MKKFKRIIALTFVILSIFLCIGCNTTYEPPPYEPPVFESGYTCRYVSSNIDSNGGLFNKKYTLSVFLSFVNIGTNEMIAKSSELEIHAYNTYTSSKKEYYGKLLIDAKFEGGYSTQVIPGNSTREIKFIVGPYESSVNSVITSKYIIYKYDGYTFGPFAWF